MQKSLLKGDMVDQNNTRHYHLHIYLFVQNRHKEFQLSVEQQNQLLMFFHRKF